MNVSIITLLIFILGLITVILSAVVAKNFSRYSNNLEGHSRNLSRAISWQLVGEAVIGLGTLVFATAAHFGSLAHWPIEAQSALRFVMFTATSVTTIHLWSVIRNNDK
jgi:hypothetical protein